jgi:hypothetical protein
MVWIHALLFRGRRRIGPATLSMIAVYVQRSGSTMQIRLGFCRLQKGFGRRCQWVGPTGAWCRLSVVSQRRLAG